MPTNCRLAVNGGAASLIAWLDYSYQKTEIEGKQEHVTRNRILLQQIPHHKKNKPMAPSHQQLLNRQGVQRISRFKPECRGIKFGTLMWKVFVGGKQKCVKN